MTVMVGGHGDEARGVVPPPPGHDPWAGAPAVPEPRVPEPHVPEPPVPEPPADLHVTLEDALEEAVAADRAGPSEEARDGGPDGLLPDGLLTDWVARAIEAYPRPSYPMTREWDVSIQGLVRLVPFVPRFATAPLGLLDRLGAVTLSDRRVGLDGRDVPWDRVLEIRTEPAWTCLSAEALEADLARFVAVLPPVPGRGWVLRRVSELLLSLYLAVLPPDDLPDDVLDELSDALRADPPAGGAGDAGRGDLLASQVVTTVVHRRRVGTGEATVSAPSALLQLALPGTPEAIVATARAHGVPVTRVPVDETAVGSVVRRAVTWRRTATTLRRDLAARWGRRP